MSQCYYIKPKVIKNDVMYSVYKRVNTIPYTNVYVAQFKSHKEALHYVQDLITLQEAV